MPDWLHSLVVVGGLTIAMMTFAIIATLIQITMVEPALIRLKWWWRLRNTHILTVSLDRIDLSLCDEYTGRVYYHSLTSDIAYWCHHNMTGRHGCAPRFDQHAWIKEFYFEKPEDAFLFKMRWI